VTINAVAGKWMGDIMDAIGFISDCLEQVQIRLLETCEGLTQEEVLWRPAPYANNIGFILWHVTRAEDNLVTRLEDGPALWVSDGWHEKFDQPVDSPDPGDRMGLRSLAIPDLSILVGYAHAVGEQTRRLLGNLTAGKLDEPIGPSRPGQNVAGNLRHLITHKNNHHGQVDYIRGLQNQTWDLPPGTGAVLP